MTSPSLSSILLRLVVGHDSQLLSSPTPTSTHRWTVFVRAQDGARALDRAIIEKVVFYLHPDFENPRRVVREPPYQVTETGYAGFTIPINISFKGVQKKYTINYDMNLTYEKHGSSLARQVLEFRQPSDALTATLLQYGGYKHSDASNAIAKEKEVSPVALAPSSSSSSTTEKLKVHIKEEPSESGKNVEEGRKKLKVKTTRKESSASASSVDSRPSKNRAEGQETMVVMDTDRLLVLQRRLMRLRDADALLRAARLLAPLSDSRLDANASQLECDLCALDSSIVGQLMEICAAASPGDE